jgi:hypothetical protein
LRNGYCLGYAAATVFVLIALLVASALKPQGRPSAR